MRVEHNSSSRAAVTARRRAQLEVDVLLVLFDRHLAALDDGFVRLELLAHFDHLGEAVFHERLLTAVPRDHRGTAAPYLLWSRFLMLSRGRPAVAEARDPSGEDVLVAPKDDGAAHDRHARADGDDHAAAARLEGLLDLLLK
jgi:hypothetical protein